MLKKYDDLTEHQKSLVALMYSDKSTVHMYLYNFEGDKYRGRQFVPSENVEIKGDETFVSPKPEEKPKESMPKSRRHNKK